MPLCYYNEYFSNTSLWESLGDGTFFIAGGKLRIDLNNGGNYSHTGKYQYQIGSGNFDVRIDLSGYSPDDTTNGLIIKFQVSDERYKYADLAEIEYQLICAGLVHSLIGKFIVNYVVDEDLPEYPASRPTILRVRRVGTRITLYYYLGGWYSLYSKDFGARASNLTDIVLKVETSNTKGGYVEFDNLMFFDGCPDGYPKAWTTTSSTASTTSSSTNSTTTTTV